ncbi:MAG: hypothetical protein ISR65_01600 [Bacteriovoracaceae bacterium]|nr:hypothetical protein [Bacteriovoracaceae bacterium]
MSKNYQHNPLELAVYKYKKVSSYFFCPLCRCERAFTRSPRLSKMNYVHILLTTAILVLILYPIMQYRALIVFFVVWGGFELVIRALFRKEIPCPYCGFDASWYKRDIKKTRQLVKEFWDKKQQVTDEVELDVDVEATNEPVVAPPSEEVGEENIYGITQ